MTPPILGGQGRSPRDLRSDATALALTALAGLLVLGALVCRGCVA